MNRLANIRNALLEELRGNNARLRFINTRLILSVGVDLNDDTVGLRDGDKVALALDTLKKMGFLKGKEGDRGA